MPFFWVDDVYATGLLARHAHIEHTQVTQYYRIKVNETALNMQSGWASAMLRTFRSTRIMFAHMNTPELRKLRRFLFETIDEASLNYSRFKIYH